MDSNNLGERSGNRGHRYSRHTSSSSFLLGLILGMSIISLFEMKNVIRESQKQQQQQQKDDGLQKILEKMQKQMSDLPQMINSSKPDEDSGYELLWNGIAIYHDAAKSLTPTSDKVTYHTYQIMYGKFLLPYYQRKPNMKMLEIGLGCNMNYGPGASLALHKKLFPKAELWEAEYLGDCVEKSIKKGELAGIHTLVGDQGNITVLHSWIEKSGGNFDVIIDDGGHQNCQIWHSFQKLWPTVKPGGLYFIEDMQVAKWRNYRKANTETCDSNLLMPEKLKEVFDNLMYDTERNSDIQFMFCQSEACVLGKKGNDW